MQKKILITCGLFIAMQFIVLAQPSIKPNEFKIGVFGSSFKNQTVAGCDVPYTTLLDQNNQKTSTLNVFSEDGFNIFQTYSPNEWTSQTALKNMILLAAANNMKVEIGSGHYYKPSMSTGGKIYYLGYGTNVYDNCGTSIGVCQSPYSLNYFRAHINDFINNIYKVSPYKDIIWGYHICEEASFYHPMQYTNNCIGNTWGTANFFTGVEIPPTNVNNAISHYKNSLSAAGITNHKMVVMEAHHHKNINQLTNDGEGVYNPQQYIQLLNKNDNRDVFFEGSYTQFPSTDWINQSYSGMYNNGFHYLGPFKSIEYAKNFSSEVHKVINMEGTSSNPGYLQHFHSNLSVPNANWLWFQAYTSIIHGAKGIWFWDLNFSWNAGETNNWDNATIQNRYDKNYFPVNYRNYTSYLSKELRFLADKNIISSDGKTIIATKTDFADPYCIVPPASSYIPSTLPAEKRTENYGLRYTIRSNGSETYIIISNPLNVSISTTLNFASSSNQQIQSSTGVNVLFDNNQYAPSNLNYKVNRNSNINLTNGTVGNQYYIGYASNKQLPIQFGPMDVKILKFVSTPPNYNNGWDIAWSNFGSGNINGHTVNDNDLFYMADLDGDGTEEILCVNYTPVGTNDWITVLKYVDNNWEWHWSNYGSSSAGNGIYAYRNTFVVGDYDGDGKDELLGNTPNGWTTLFKFNNGNWQWIWSDNGNASHAIKPYKDKFYAGDFNGDGKDELLGCDLPNGWTTMFHWSGSDFTWGWSDYGGAHSIKPYRENMFPGDFDGDGKVELLGLNSWSTLFHFDNGNWQWGWSTNGANNFNGWTYPLPPTDRLLSGNIDYSDSKDELFFLQTGPNANSVATMDLKNDQNGWNWNWSANTLGIPYIDDWSIHPNVGTNTKYYLVKAKASEPKYLLAMRKYCGSYLVNMYKSNNSNKSLHIESDNALRVETDISIFPNPSQGKVQISSESIDIQSVEVYNLQGKVFYNKKYGSERNMEIDLSRFSDGIYFFRIISSENRVSIHKIILSK
jgi:hypothetical protein